MENYKIKEFSKTSKVNLPTLYKIYPHFDNKNNSFINYNNYKKCNLYKIIDKLIIIVKNLSISKNQNKEILIAYIQSIIDKHYLLKLPLNDPNYYFAIVYDYIEKLINVNQKNKIDKCIKNLPKLIDIIKKNIIYTKKIYIEKLEYSLIYINDLKIHKDYKDILLLNFNKLIKYYEKKNIYINYNFTIENLNIIFTNQELYPVNLEEIYNYAKKEYKEIKKLFIKNIESIDNSDKLSTQNKVNKYLESFETTKNIIDYTKDLYTQIKEFLIKKNIDKKYLNYKLHIEINDYNNWIIYNYDKKILLYLPNEKKYHKYLYINSLIHEYMHYIQYSSDIINKNNLSLDYDSLVMGEGVAYYFEEWFYNNKFNSNKHYTFSYLYDNLLRLTRFIISYEYHNGMLNISSLYTKFKHMTFINNLKKLEIEIYRLINNIDSMEYYIGKYYIKQYLEKNKNYNPLDLLINGSLCLKYALT